MDPRFEIYEDDGWRWLLVDSNGEPIASGEPYSSRAAAQEGARNVQETAPVAEIMDRPWRP